MTTNTAVLSIQNLVKYYGSIKALDGISYDIPKGCVYGILGPNGSGKTTTLGIVLNVLNQTSGTYLWFGNPANADTRKKIGSLLETPNFYHYLSAVDNLKITQSINKRGTEEDIHKVLEIVNLAQRKNSKFSTYSLGMKQRLAIAAALLGNPEVLVLDEPTNGLDPVGIAEIRELIKSLAENGKTIIMASHLLDEVEKVCTHVAIMKKGVLITAGAVKDVLVNEDIVEISCANNEKLVEIMKLFPEIQNIQIEKDKLLLYFLLGKANLEAINQYCFSNNIVLNLLTMKHKSLETKFFELTNN
ncbi:MAG TPA: ATP-binding cassette domain-containing protein [Chitinophagaceae bacterium]|nr:ATP-binding cassette domain-containing protein [Chitinophagaceae bacterium]HNJ58040.1 ATP-binding cassette domain-containing protein [Chitinophagaceae bacterium]HNM33921.1 ATP-binding cassette domain-containing protein [Chitinophagaceae bacterium]HNN31040.1 ATP-binding cassette domain-containing protein [Chitinophagaceae bacterium]